MASRTTLARLAQAVVVPVSTNMVFCELQRTWNRPDAAAFGALYGAYAPNYQAVMESFQKAQEAILWSYIVSSIFACISGESSPFMGLLSCVCVVGRFVPAHAWLELRGLMISRRATVSPACGQAVPFAEFRLPI